MQAIPDYAHCQHCGLTVNAGVAFCCQGCESVYALLAERGLKKFYTLRDQHSFRKPPPAKEFSALTAVQDLWARLDTESKSKFYLEGIHCLGCLWLMEKLPEIEPRIKASSLDFAHQILEIEIQDNIKWQEVLLLIARLGYSAKPIAATDGEELRRNDLRTQLGRMGIAAFCAGNIMLLSVSIYGGTDLFWGIRFGWLSLILALPVLTYSAWPIYKAAFFPLLRGKISLDLAIAFALLAGAALSAWSLISGSQEHIYFDSLSALVFLLLSSRYILTKFRENLAKENICLSFLSDDRYRRISPNPALVSADGLMPEDELDVSARQKVPVDSILQNASACFDFSLLTGESRPVKMLPGDRVEAGAILIDETCRLRALLPVGESRLARILEQIRAYQLKRSPSLEFADRLGKYFVLFSLSLAVALAFFFPGEEGIRRALALVIVTCPCVLAFAVPLAFTRAMQIAARRGILFVAPEKLEALARVKTIFFDKTGTLTNGTFEVLGWQQIAGSLEITKKAALSLEARSSHPVGKAIARYCSITEAIPASAIREVPGYGVIGEIAGQHWKIGKAPLSDNAQNIVNIFQNDRLQAVITLGDRLREESPGIVAAFQKKGVEAVMLSGDHPENAAAVAKAAGIKKWTANLLPEEKAVAVAAVKNSAMVGDGANDAVAFQGAEVGIAVQGAMDISLKNCDLVITSPGLSGVLEAREIAERTVRIVRANFALTLSYNLLAGTLAITGFMQPLWAALIMPLSAFSVFIFTHWQMREHK